MERGRLPVVVLAAGFSRRMGRCKLTLPFEGEPLVRRAVRAALEGGLSPVFVTLRPDASPDLRGAVAGFGDGVIVVPAPEARRGQAESLKAGVKGVMQLVPAPLGAAVLLGDQPLVDGALVRELAAFFLEAPDAAAAPAYKGVRGNPVILPARAFNAVMELEGDAGARSLLTAFGLRLMPTNDTAAVTDVDTREAYESLRARARP